MFEISEHHDVSFQSLFSIGPELQFVPIIHFSVKKLVSSMHSQKQKGRFCDFHEVAKETF